MKTTLAIAVTLSAGISLTQLAHVQAADGKLGTVNFETSCKPEAQKLFNQAMLYQHSFWYRASQNAFEEVLKADPQCGIAYWGIALSMLWNPHVPTPAKNLADGSVMIAKGKSLGAGTQRERDYLDALAVMYTDFDKVDHRTRVVAYAKAMEQLAQRYPNDDEAQIHYALALNTSASAADKTYANQIKGAAILEPISLRQPQHPGVAHYLIHLYDYPSIAEKGLDAARRYAKIAPDAAHAQHMPSHIFTRVGYWDESIASNIQAARVAKTIRPPDLADQLVRRHDHAGLPREAVEHPVFERRQVDLLFVRTRETAREIDRHVTDLQHGRLTRATGIAAQRRPHPREQFRRAERLRHVVVGAGVERGDLLRLHRARGEHDDRHRRPRSHARDDLETIVVGQTEIDEQQIGLVAARLDVATLRRRGLDDAIVHGLQQHAQHVADGRIVLDHEDLVHRLRHAGGARVGNVSSKRAPPPGR